MQPSSTSQWRTFNHPCRHSTSFASCQIIDQRTRVVHLIPLHSYQCVGARAKTPAVNPLMISNALWPTAPEHLRRQLPEMLINYLTQVRSDAFPQPSVERKMISFSIYTDGSHSWPAITTLTEEGVAAPL